MEATIEDEGVELADSEIDIDGLKPNPVRLGISIKITNETINHLFEYAVKRAGE